MDSAYLEFCITDEQRRVLNAVIEHKSNSKAAKALDKDRRAIDRMLGTIRLQAERRGYSPAHGMIHATPPTHIVKGTSTYYDRDGVQAGQWVKTDRVAESLAESIRAVVEGLKDEIPRAAKVPVPAAGNTDLHNAYIITDYHLGMLAWGEECGEDWDLAKAETLLYQWFEAAILAAPRAATATFAQLGDFIHWDGLDAVTPASKHILDADTRFPKVVRAAIRMIRRIIRLLLTRHQSITVIMADANHDPASGVWMREMLAEFYDHEPRVTVDNSPDSYYAVRFGKTLTMYHHGHKRNVSNVDSVMVAKFREDYGQTTYHYCHTGHLHHDKVRESNLMHIEQHETLSAKDAYASRHGFMSHRSAKVITYSKEYGEVSRVTIRPEMLS
jgi:hypothetical protein